MIILDINVISELMLRSPEPAVSAWFTMQSRQSAFTTAVSLAEIFYGIRILPAGRRRQDLEDLAAGIFFTDFGDRVLPFDGAAGDIYASISAHRRINRYPECRRFRASRSRYRQSLEFQRLNGALKHFPLPE